MHFIEVKITTYGKINNYQMYIINEFSTIVINQIAIKITNFNTQYTIMSILILPFKVETQRISTFIIRWSQNNMIPEQGQALELHPHS